MTESRFPVQITPEDKFLPVEWCRLKKIMILDTDGWRGKDAPSFLLDEITEAEFDRRAWVSTIKIM